MGKIRQLDPLTVAKIAAGEVIERPASVVKELMENSIDAGATRIVITCRGGGFDLIEVVDDGCGMSPEDARAAFARHSTSKLSHVDDLSCIRTLGFRGEALPSIAAAGKVEMVTCTGTGTVGTRLLLEEDLILREEPVAAPPGTRVTVREVLANLPARRKFLGDARREGLRVVDAVTRQALGYPEIAFRLEMDGRVVLSTSGSGKLSHCLAEVYGPEVARQVIPLSASDPPFAEVYGLLGGPGLARARRWAQMVYVNRRPVRVPALIGAVEASYGDLLPPGRHPFVLLGVNVDAGQVDVNVHPAKAEVRLAGEGRAKELVVQAVREALRASDLSGQLNAGKTLWPATWSVETAVEPMGDGGWWAAGRTGEQPGTSQVGEQLVAWGDVALPFGALRPLGDLLGTYVLAEGPDGLYVVDQHAAHERVFYEQILPAGESQVLAVPVVVEMGGPEVELVTSFTEELRESGFVAETWGPGSVVLRAAPTWAAGREEACFRHVLDRLAEETMSGGERPTTGELVDRAEAMRRATAACHASVRANRRLFPEEMAALLHSLARCAHPWTCPHGRPTVLKLSRAQLERHFGRR